MSNKLNIAIFVGALLAGTSIANAADITRTYVVAASNFSYQEGPNPSAPPPITSFKGSYTITFDPAVDTVDSTAGLVVNYLSYPASTAYSFDPKYSTIDIATHPGDATSESFPPNTYGLYINSPTATSYSDSFGQVFVSDSSDDLYASFTALETVSSGVPEPSTWVMMLAGVGTIGGMMRLRQKSGQSFLLA